VIPNHFFNKGLLHKNVEITQPNGPTLSFLVATSTMIMFFIEPQLPLSKQLSECTFHKSFHKCHTICFIVFNETFMKNKSLYQNIIACWFESINDSCIVAFVSFQNQLASCH
jgi:hypothetical protein